MSVTSDDTFDCVFCALDAHNCYGCMAPVTHEQAPYCGPECRERFRRGEGWLKVCGTGECEQPTYSSLSTVCWTHQEDDPRLRPGRPGGGVR